MANQKTEQKPAQQAGILDDYMFDQLKNTREYGRYLEDKGEKTLNYYLVFVTAIVGVVAGVLVGEKTTEIQKFTALALGSFFIGGVGVLVYFWEMAFASARIIETWYTMIFHLYFRKKDPITYDKFGLPKLLTILRRRKNPGHLPLFTIIGFISIQLIGLFSSFMLGLSLWAYIQLAPLLNLSHPSVFGLSSIQLSSVFSITMCLVLFLFGYFGYYRAIKSFQWDISSVTKNL